MTIKKRIRSDQSAMPFKQISKLMIDHLAATAIFWLNAFPPSKPRAGLSSTKFPGQLVLWNVLY